MSQPRVVVACGTPVPHSPMPLSSSNFGSLRGSGSDLDGVGTRCGSTTGEKLDALLSKFVHFEAQIAQIPALTTCMSRMDSHITKTLVDFATRLAELEQNLCTFTARLCKVETYAASASNVSGSARSWPSLEQVDGSTAASSHGPAAPRPKVPLCVSRVHAPAASACEYGDSGAPGKESSWRRAKNIRNLTCLALVSSQIS